MKAKKQTVLAVVLSEEELGRVRQRASSLQLTLPNFVRKRLGLLPAKRRGFVAGSKRALPNKVSNIATCLYLH